MIKFEDYVAQDSCISLEEYHTDEGYNDHDDHSDHVDTWVDEGSLDYGHSGHCDCGD